MTDTVSHPEMSSEQLTSLTKTSLAPRPKPFKVFNTSSATQKGGPTAWVGSQVRSPLHKSKKMQKGIGTQKTCSEILSFINQPCLGVNKFNNYTYKHVFLVLLLVMSPCMVKTRMIVLKMLQRLQEEQGQYQIPEGIPPKAPRSLSLSLCFSSWEMSPVGGSN